MMYDLPLLQPYGHFQFIDFKANIKTRDKIASIGDLKKKLIYFNQHIRSLSTYAMDGQIYFEWGNPDQILKIFCGCKSCRSLPDFNMAQYDLFYHQREKEVNRIIKSIGNLKTYKEKLAFFFGIKGYIPDHSPKVFANIPFDDEKDPSREIWITEPVIDLSPATRAEIMVYNEFVSLDFNKEFRVGTGFSKNYNGFNFQTEKKRLDETLGNSLHPQNLIDYLITKIEKHFGYPDNLNSEYKEAHITKKINEQLEQQHGVLLNSFTKMVLGVPIDLNKHKLDSYTLMNYTHVSQVFMFYKYLKLYGINSVMSIEKKGKLNMQESSLLQNQDDILNITELRSWLYQSEIKNFQHLIEGFETLEKYINKNVHEDVRADLLRSKQLNRNLTNWKQSIKSIFDSFSNTKPYNAPHLSENAQNAKKKLENKIDGALEIIHLRIKDMETPIQDSKPAVPSGNTNSFHKSMPLDVPQEHFKVFTEQKSKNGKPYLTVDQLDLFLKKAFSGQNDIPKIKFNQAPKGEKLLIQAVFYEFYNTNCFEYFNTMQCQDKFILLLTDNFEGWNFENVKENFTPKTKKRL